MSQKLRKEEGYGRNISEAIGLKRRMKKLDLLIHRLFHHQLIRKQFLIRE
jgi:hypothetical protein